MDKARAEKTLFIAKEAIKNGQKFTFDCSALLPLAGYFKDFLLNKIIPNDLFVITPTVSKELKGLQNSHPELKDVVSQISRLKKVGKPEPDDVNRHKLIYDSMSQLLPRKIAHEIMITDEKSYLNEGVRIFEEGRKKLANGSLNRQSVFQKIHFLRKRFEHIAAEAKQKLMKRLARFDIDISGFDFDKFLRVVDNEVKVIRMQFDSALTNAGPSINNLFSACVEFRDKSYEADIIHMAEVKALNSKNITEDSDQLFLLEFHSRTA